MQGNERLIPVTGTTATGPGGRVAEWVPAESTDRDAYALHVATTDLSPRYMVGEVLVLHPNAAPTPGEEVMVLTTEGALMVCTLISALNGMVVVAPINSQYDQTTLPYSAIRMLHPVAASYRRSTIVRGGKPVST